MGLCFMRKSVVPMTRVVLVCYFSVPVTLCAKSVGQFVVCQVATTYIHTLLLVTSWQPHLPYKIKICRKIFYLTSVI